MSGDDTVARRVVVHGRVQGVFFRDSCRQRAERSRVAGWVRNEPDGTVAALFEGALHDVEQLVDWCRQGPPHARVEQVEVLEASPAGRRGFDVLR
jgi:acylphosphatase